MRLQVLEFITHLNAYKVLELDEMACVKQKDLKDFHPLSLCKGLVNLPKVVLLF